MAGNTRTPRGNESKTPARLLDQSGLEAQALAAFDARTGGGDGEEHAWRAVRARIAPQSSPSRRWLSSTGRWALGAAGAGALALVVILSARSRLEERGQATAGPTALTTATATATANVHRGASPFVPRAPTPAAQPRILEPASPRVPVVPRVALATAPRVLSSGASALDDEAIITVNERAHVTAVHEGGHTRIALASGGLRAQVQPRPPGHELSVDAGDYRFVVVGTVFRVARSAGNVDLWVDEGRVAVWNGERELETIGAGGHWRSPASQISAAMPADTPSAGVVDSAPRPLATGNTISSPPATLAQPSPATVVTPATQQPTPSRPAAQSEPRALATCRALADHPGAGDALACYRGLVATGKDLEAQNALYQMAQLQRERFGDPQAALATLAEYRRRFPEGALRAEVDITRVELLPRVHRYDEALAESAALLASNPHHERAGELHLLRGNILREVQHDCARADDEYARAAEPGRGIVADEASFLRAACLESTGRRAEAASAYKRYLERPDPRHAPEARARLTALTR